MISSDLLATYPNWFEHFKKLEKYASEIKTRNNDCERYRIRKIYYYQA